MTALVLAILAACPADCRPAGMVAACARDVQTCERRLQHDADVIGKLREQLEQADAQRAAEVGYWRDRAVETQRRRVTVLVLGVVAGAALVGGAWALAGDEPLVAAGLGVTSLAAGGGGITLATFD